MKKYYPLWSLRRPVRDKKWVWAGGLFALLIVSLAVASASDGDSGSTCTMPADAVTVVEVTDWRDDYTHAAHVKQWNQVLEALGEDTGTGVAPMTASAALIKYQRFQNNRWDRTYRTLKALEDCEAAATTTTTSTTTTTTAAAQDAQQDPPTPMPQQEVELSYTSDPESVTIVEGESGTLTFRLIPSPAPGQTGCRLVGVLRTDSYYHSRNSGDYPPNLRLSAQTTGYHFTTQDPWGVRTWGWYNAGCTGTLRSDGHETYTVTYSSGTDDVRRPTSRNSAYLSVPVKYGNFPGLHYTQAHLKTVATINIVDRAALNISTQPADTGPGGSFMEEGTRTGIKFVAGANPFHMPVEIKYRKCEFENRQAKSAADETCQVSGPYLDWSGADVERWGVSGLKACPDGGICIYPPQDGWTPRGASASFIAYLYDTDDNRVSKSSRWEICAIRSKTIKVEGEIGPSRCTDVYAMEDDLLQIGLRSGNWKGDHRLVDLTVHRDYWQDVTVNLTATGAARMTRVGTIGQGSQTAAAKANTTTLPALENSRGAVEIRAVCSGAGDGWIEATHDVGTADRVQVCPAPATKTKVSDHATATFQLRMACQTWFDSNGGTSRLVNSEMTSSGWEQLIILPPNPLPPGTVDDDYRVTDLLGNRVYPYDPRPCNTEHLTIWSLLGPQTAQVKCTVGESMVTALDSGSLTASAVIDRITDHIGPAYRAGCYS